MNQIFNFRSRQEARLVRTGLKILRDGCKCGPDRTNYKPYGFEPEENYYRDLKRCGRELKIINRLLVDLKGM